jgi:hypothetical protein
MRIERERRRLLPAFGTALVPPHPEVAAKRPSKDEAARAARMG